MYAEPCKKVGYQIKAWLIQGDKPGELNYAKVNRDAQLVDEAPLEPWDLLYGGGCRNDWLAASKLLDKVLYMLCSAGALPPW